MMISDDDLKDFQFNIDANHDGNVDDVELQQALVEADLILSGDNKKELTEEERKEFLENLGLGFAEERLKNRIGEQLNKLDADTLAGITRAEKIRAIFGDWVMPMPIKTEVIAIKCNTNTSRRDGLVDVPAGADVVIFYSMAANSQFFHFILKGQNGEQGDSVLSQGFTYFQDSDGVSSGNTRKKLSNVLCPITHSKHIMLLNGELSLATESYCQAVTTTELDIICFEFYNSGQIELGL